MPYKHKFKTNSKEKQKTKKTRWRFDTSKHIIFAIESTTSKWECTEWNGFFGIVGFILLYDSFFVCLFVYIYIRWADGTHNNFNGQPVLMAQMYASIEWAYMHLVFVCIYV